MTSALYVKLKKLGIGRALQESNPNFFPRGDREILDRIEITGFELVGDPV